MTDPERKFPLSDAALLTATDDELHADWSTRFRLGTGAAAAQRDAIVRAVRADEAKRRADLEAALHGYRKDAERLRAQLATARTDGAREALTRLADLQSAGAGARAVRYVLASVAADADAWHR